MDISSPGQIVVIVAIVLFYIKLAVQQFLKSRREARKTNLEIRKAKKEARKAQTPQRPEEKAAIQVKNWWWVAGSLVIAVLGLTINSFELGLPAGIVSAWWIPVTLGIVSLSFAIY